MERVNVKCPHCGAILQTDIKDAAICDKCGEAFVVQRAIDYYNRKKKCPKCGSDVLEGYAFCFTCGAKLSDEGELTNSLNVNEEKLSKPMNINAFELEKTDEDLCDVEVKPILCKKCGTILHDGDLFCYECGSPVTSNSNMVNESDHSLIIPEGEPAKEIETHVEKVDVLEDVQSNEVLVEPAPENVEQVDFVSMGFELLRSKQDNKFLLAEDAFHKALESDSCCAEAYWGLFLATERKSTLDEYFEECFSLVKTDEYETCEYKFNIERSYEDYVVPGYLSLEQIKQSIQLDNKYESNKNSLIRQRDKVVSDFNTNVNIKNARNFGDEFLSGNLDKVVNNFIKSINKLIEKSTIEDKKAIEKITSNPQNSKATIEKRLNELKDNAEAEKKDDANKKRIKKHLFAIVLLIIIIIVAVVGSRSFFFNGPYCNIVGHSYEIEGSFRCDWAGDVTQRCSRCGDRFTTWHKKEPHNFGEWIIIPKRIDDGYILKESECEKCHFKEIQYIPSTK